MKAIKFIILFLVLFIFISSINAYLDFSDVTLGSSSQARGENATTTITITNKGSSLIKDLSISFNANSIYKLEGSLSKTSLNPNESTALTITGFVPLNFDAVDIRGRKKSFDIGNLTLNGKYENNTPVSKTTNIFMETENKLRFTTGSKIFINGVEKTLRNDREYKDIKRGDKIELSVEIENRFSTSGDCQEDGSDCDIEDIELNVESANSDLDVDESVDYSTLRSNKKATKKVSFEIPDDIDDDDYTIYMWVTGEDENGALHGDNWQFDLTVEVPRDEITITSFNLEPSELTCKYSTTLSVTIKNTGTDDQDDVSIWVDSTTPNIEETADKINLDEGERITKTFNLYIPENTKPGQYSILIRANVDYDQETDREVAILKVNECKTQPSQPTQPVQPSEPNIPSVPSQPTDVNIIEVPPTAGVIYGREKATFTESNEFIILLAGIVIIGILALLLLIAVLLKK